MACCQPSDEEIKRIRLSLSESSSDAMNLANVTELNKGGFVIKTRVGNIQIGMPPETIKDCMVQAIDVPGIFVVPSRHYSKDTFINVAEFEFPAYFNFFIKRRRIKLVCTKEQEEKIRVIFQETLLGPLDFPVAAADQNLDDEFHELLPKAYRPDFPVELGDMAVNPFTKEKLVVATLIEFLSFSEEGCCEVEPGLSIRKSEGTFEVEFRTISRTSVIEDATQTLLMEGMRRVDEWVRLLEGLPPLDHILTLDERLLAVRPEPLASVEATLLRRFDGRRTIIEIIDDTGVDDLEVLQMIGSLYFEGLLTDELGSGDDELVEPPTTEVWDPAVTRAGVPPLPTMQVETVVPVATAADLPPLPAFPLPFPNLSANAEHDDVLVGGIPEDVRELPAEPEIDQVLAPTTSRQRITDKAPPSAIIEALTVHRLEAIDGHIAVPMGTARAEAFGELQSRRGDAVPDIRTHAASSSIARPPLR